MFKFKQFLACLAFSCLSISIFANDLPKQYSLQALGKESKRYAPAEVTLIQFWASWCHSCKGLMWDLDSLVGAEVAYLAVSVDDEYRSASRHIAQHELKNKRVNRFWYDSKQKMAEQYSVNTIPTVVILGKNSEVLYRTSGHLNGGDLMDIKNMLKKSTKNK